MKRLFFLLSFLQCSLFGLQAQTELSDYHPGMTAEGAVYFLPKTAIRVSVLVEKKVYTPGDFSNYAMRYLRLRDVAQEPSTTYRVVGIQQTAVGVADTSKAYAVKFNAKTVAANLALSDDGCLLAINAQASKTKQPTLFRAAPKQKVLNPRSFMNEEILAAGSTAKMAELTANEIYDLRENRNLLIKGQADFMPNDAAQMKMMLDRLEQQELAMRTLFTGITVTDTTETVITVVPGDSQRQVLFRISQRLGIVDDDDLSGVPYYINVENLNILPPVAEDPTGKSKKKQPEAGIYVNVAGRMRSTITQQDDTMLSVEEFPAGQFGHVELLSGELFNKRYTTHLWLNPVTGAVERLEGEQPK
ncbi:MAG: DUF4831 family protein [Prevotella sp.]|nr:DUF4831 family protein [Prevotella sp.]